MAVTLDGKIAKNSNHFPDWTSKEDKKMFARISREHGVIIMGDKTFDTFPAPLKDRLNVVFTMKENLEPTEGVKWVSGDVEKVLKELEDEGYTKAILGGGAFLNTTFLEKNLIDEIYITMEPRIFGEGLSMFNGDFNKKLELKKVEKINDNSVVLNYKVIK